MAKLHIGYTLSSEEHPPHKLIEYATQAEQMGFDFLSISDHIFPWIDRQGQSPFVWTMLGALSQSTKSIPIMTGVTCPLIRLHPVIVAQAAATAASLLEGRFWLGLGTGENLNEHVVGQGWPNINRRQEMLEEAIQLIRQLWTGQLVDHLGAYYAADQAKIYTLPDQLPPIYLAAGGSDTATIAGQLADGLIATSPDSEVVKQFDQSSSQSKPKIAQITVSVDHNHQAAQQTALDIWPNAAISGQASQELPMPAHFQQLASSVTLPQIDQAIICGVDIDQHLRQIQVYIDAGFTHLYFHQVGPNQQAFFDFYTTKIIPQIREANYG